MRILYLAHRVPFPPNKGEKIRAFHQICGLAARGHEVHVLAFADDPEDRRHERALADRCASAAIVPLDTRAAAIRALAALAGQAPWSLAYFRSGRMREAVARAARAIAPQAWITYSSPMTPYVPDDCLPHTVADLIDLDSEKWRDYAAASAPPRSWAYATEARRLRTHERRVAAACGATLLASAFEADLLRRELAPAAASRLHALVHGVDAAHFRPRTPGETSAPVPPGERAFLADASPAVVFTGAMDYRPNIDGVRWFVREIWPRIVSVRPDARFLIVGSKPAAAVRALSRTAGVTVTGYVADTQPYLAAAAVAVAPLRIARGVQSKILEAMACGTPVVSTRAALAGLAAKPGVDVLPADDPGEFAAAVVSLLTDAEQARRVGTAGRAFAAREHAWETMIARLEELVASVAQRTTLLPEVVGPEEVPG